jgi:hypothetical protein
MIQTLLDVAIQFVDIVVSCEKAWLRQRDPFKEKPLERQH